MYYTEEKHIGEYKPIHALMLAMDCCINRAGPKAAKTPGYIIKRMHKKYRNKLKKLKSKDLEQLRFENYFYYDSEYFAKKHVSNTKMKFDKELRRYSNPSISQCLVS